MIMKDEHPEQNALIWPALFWGGAWGLCEATFGHVLHMARIPGLPALVMFPIGAALMMRAWRETGRLQAILICGAAAASVKLGGLLIPAVDVFAVVNPARAILLQSLAFAGIAAAAGSRRFSLPFSAFVAVSLSWRLFYAGLALTEGRWWGFANISDSTLSIPVFVLAGGMAGAVLAFAACEILLPGKQAFRPAVRKSPAAAFALVAAALAAELLI